MQKRFTKNAEKALNYAKKSAKSLGHNYTGTEHILLGLLKSKGVAADILQANNVDADGIKELMEDFLSFLIAERDIFQLIDRHPGVHASQHTPTGWHLIFFPAQSQIILQRKP